MKKNIPTITPQEVEHRLQKGEKLNIIDVREEKEVAEGKIPEAKHMALGTLPDRLHELDPSKEYIMVCRSGGRSERACEFLQEHGFKVKNMVGGMLAWKGKTQ
ncbi:MULTISPECIES: rhodanese-like domain-containing protein [unclassified Thermoactinomyces]|uniref:rhodanese-like domain-containing protein n=1 Tax=unclassified Thermoactinomyces TaxID=2634588 RepID=UPI0018DCF2BF|nr:MULTISPECIES: rhodanese-like domain-containing protein [unclassified Thermoactinomyces]MBH8598621.1 rhodanese-like domain-containing protein [Thermoactinomyces sp. CICC 10523]MBH8605123.1 rhodanese-like domain-containing protein [Thermoactinomyces sp. CICC 10522]MBH8609061.1 rhodanese-like domain-containing protein [Thermoactinomyces sp. CICC 10521]